MNRGSIVCRAAPLTAAFAAISVGLAGREADTAAAAVHSMAPPPATATHTAAGTWPDETADAALCKQDLQRRAGSSFHS